ncbi:serine/threonine-protein kinase SBK1-like [Pleurodeles waltl]|uniref:serine/threonine-protein kinase SBK1-like n=1 Tax=Pleurodeles waltl TaxID=8319 RepID=UPI0037095243
MDPPHDTGSLLKELMIVIARTTEMVDIGQRFEVDQKLGQGTFGKVVRARHRESGTMMALKLLRKNRIKRKAFLRELCISLLLSSHPSIISTYRLSCHTPYHYVIVQELAVDGDLHSCLQPQVGMAEEKVKRVARQLASALEYMHDRSLVHRDVKPDNVLLMDQECHGVRLADFGLTRVEGYLVACASRIIPYMAPEYCQLKRTQVLAMDPSLDIWAFGVLLFTILTGHFPWGQALATDRGFKAYMMWQDRAEDARMPRSWRRLTPAARHMFSRLLALSPAWRLPMEDIGRYLDTPWKVASLPSNAVGSVSSAEEDSSPAMSEDPEAAQMPQEGSSLYPQQHTWLSVGAEVELT